MHFERALSSITQHEDGDCCLSLSKLAYDYCVGFTSPRRPRPHARRRFSPDAFERMLTEGMAREKAAPGTGFRFTNGHASPFFFSPPSPPARALVGSCATHKRAPRALAWAARTRRACASPKAFDAVPFDVDMRKASTEIFRSWPRVTKSEIRAGNLSAGHRGFFH